MLLTIQERSAPPTFQPSFAPVFYVGLHSVGWFGSRVVSVLDSGTGGPGFKSQPRRSRVTVFGNHIHRASVHQAAKLVAALLIVARVMAGLAESNGSLSPGL